MKILHNTKVASNWKCLGVMLKIKVSSLDTIAAKHPHKPEDCLMEVLQMWLNGTSSWVTLIEALQVLEQEKLALELKKDHLQ